jgi:ribosome-binding protein aMBF1 (putative translation factor)
MSKKPMLTNYVSEIDQDLQKFDKEHPTPSSSQQKEIEKYARIYFLRDVADRPEQPKTLWEDF